MKKSTIAIIVLVLVVVLGGAGVFALIRDNGKGMEHNVTDVTMEKSDDMMIEKTSNTMDNEDEVMTKTESSAGSYIAYADYAANKSNYHQGNVVLFFNASWCPTCKALTKDINANLSSIPSGVTIVSVDYDSSSELKKQYGITYQHTFVKIDPNGNQIKKWSGSPTLSSLLSQI